MWWRGVSSGSKHYADVRVYLQKLSSFRNTPVPDPRFYSNLLLSKLAPDCKIDALSSFSSEPFVAHHPFSPHCTPFSSPLHPLFTSTAPPFHPPLHPFPGLCGDPVKGSRMVASICCCCPRCLRKGGPARPAVPRAMEGAGRHVVTLRFGRTFGGHMSATVGAATATPAERPGRTEGRQKAAGHNDAAAETVARDGRAARRQASGLRAPRPPERAVRVRASVRARTDMAAAVPPVRPPRAKSGRNGVGDAVAAATQSTPSPWGALGATPATPSRTSAGR